jgi:chemotaxis protein MotB
VITEDKHDIDTEEENYFVSMSDMMVGLVFVFIIMLMYFALQFQTVTDQLTGADAERAAILRNLQTSLQARGVEVSIDTQNGVLRLPDAILFDSARAELKPEGIVAVGHLADALGDILPCYTDDLGTGASRPATCNPSAHRIESIYIEGHTDSDALAGSGLLRDNWDLSVARATNTYRELTRRRIDLAERCSRKRERCEPVLSVSGYGPQRPVAIGDTAEDKRRNRRIDLRIIMVAPNSDEAVEDISEELRR